MFKIIRNFINRSLKQKSEKAINVFRRTISQLEAINEKAMVEADEFNKQAQDCMNKSKERSSLVQDNSKIISKIKNIID